MRKVYDYKVNDEDNPTLFSFYSEGRERIKKIVAMQTVEWQAGVVNMVLADEVAPGEVDTQRNSNNGDVYVILNTCADIIRHYLTKHPTDSIYIKGADSRRERVYQELLVRTVKQNPGEFLVLGRRDAASEFEIMREGVNYIGFLIIPQT